MGEREGGRAYSNRGYGQALRLIPRRAGRTSRTPSSVSARQRSRRAGSVRSGVLRFVLHRLVRQESAFRGALWSLDDVADRRARRRETAERGSIAIRGQRVRALSVGARSGRADRGDAAIDVARMRCLSRREAVEAVVAREAPALRVLRCAVEPDIAESPCGAARVLDGPTFVRADRAGPATPEACAEGDRDQASRAEPEHEAPLSRATPAGEFPAVPLPGAHRRGTHDM